RILQFAWLWEIGILGFFWDLRFGLWDLISLLMLNSLPALPLTLTLALAFAVSFGHAADDYKLGPDSQFKADVPHGRVERFQFTNSIVFPGTVRDGGLYVPAQYDPLKPAALMVFQYGM